MASWAAHYLEWTTAGEGNLVRTEYAFPLRQADGSTRVVHETHHTGPQPRNLARGIEVIRFWPPVLFLPAWGLAS